MSRSRRSIRLTVIQLLVVSLFGTLLVRLAWIQLATGETLRAVATSQAAREVIDQPDRGLILDAQGRALATNRLAWVVSIDRHTLGLMSRHDRRILLERICDLVDSSPEEIKQTLSTWNGTAYQPVPIAKDVPRDVALRILEQPEDFPAVVAEKESLRSYPAPYGANLAHVLGYLSPITRKEHRATVSDDSLNAASVVGRAGVEKTYDDWLRGMPGSTLIPVDAQGNPTGAPSTTTPSASGDTLVTSIDARVQALVENQLASAIATARATYDPETHKNFVADSGAAIVMEADTGRIVAMASQPTYDPEVWSGGISQDELNHLYSEAAGEPLLPRATQGQFAPASTWKPLMAVGALSNGYTTETRLNCSSFVQVGNRAFQNYESSSYGYLDFARALQLSCDTFFYRIGLSYWNQYGSDPTDLEARDPLVATAKDFGLGSATGIDLPAESSGRIADRKWKLAYYKQMKSYYCTMDSQGTAPSAYLKLFAHEFCLEGYYYRAGDAVNFSIGQGDTLVTPLQLARAYGALANGGDLMKPTVGKAIIAADGTVLKQIKPKVTDTVHATSATLAYVDAALRGTPVAGTLAGVFAGFPLDQVPVRGKTGTGEVYGKQTTSWVATYDDDYVVVVMISQGGTGAGGSGSAARAIWEGLYGVEGTVVDHDKALITGVVASDALPSVQRNGAIWAPEGSK
ncbi:MAG: penicillin-binding protein 2 [Nocardioides sp.]